MPFISQKSAINLLASERGSQGEGFERGGGAVVFKGKDQI